MRQSFSRLLFLPLLGLLLVSCRTTSPAAKPAILCHYMSWFQWRTEDGVNKESHWSWQGKTVSHDPRQVLPTGLRDIASVFYPRIGLYDSADPDVIDYHILSAKAAGIEGFVVDWYRPDDEVDQALQVLFARAEALNFKIAVCMEEKMCFPDWYGASNRAEALQRGTDLVGYILRTYADRPAYWRINGKPAIFVFNGWGEWGDAGQKTFSGPEWAQIARTLDRRDWYVVSQHFDLKSEFVRAAYGWLGEAEHRKWVHQTGHRQIAAGMLDFYVAPANPGFDDRGVWGWGNGPRLQPALGTETYNAYWRLIQEYHPAAVQIATWNDFGEGTVIEPTAQTGTLYLDSTEQAVFRLTGRPRNLEDNALPYRWFLASKRHPGTPAIATIREALTNGQSKRAAQLLQELDGDLQVPSILDVPHELPPWNIQTPEWSARSEILQKATTSLNLARQATATASSQESAEHTPAGAIDGDLQTRWASEHRDEQWLQLSWPQAITASEIALIWESAYAKAFDVQLSNDGQTWQTVATVTGGHGGSQHLALPKKTFRHLRLALHSRGTTWGFSMYELCILRQP